MSASVFFVSDGCWAAKSMVTARGLGFLFEGAVLGLNFELGVPGRRASGLEC